MAKGYALGTWKGKKGSSVFYKIWNSNNKVSQGIREYQPQVSNPQSDGQASQRMKMQPQANIARVLREIISRSFEGVKYGATSRLLFRKLAMNLNEGFPYLVKGDQRPCPGTYQISRGSLNPIIGSYSQSGSQITFDSIQLISNTGQEVPTSAGEVIQNILNHNSDLKEGDQLTFVYCVINDITDAQPFLWSYGSIVLDTTMTQNWVDYLFANNLGVFEEAVGDGKFGSLEMDVYAFGCIVSRLDSTGTYYLRSTSVLNVYEPALEDFFSPQKRSASRRSYQKQTTRNTDWPVQEYDDDNLIQGEFTIETVSEQAYNSIVGQKCLVLKDVETDEVVYVLTTDFLSEPGYLTGTDGHALTVTISSEVTGVLPSKVPALAGLPTRVYHA